MNVQFENDFQQKVMYVSFGEGTHIAKTSDVLMLRSKWTQELKSWHSPYKALIDATNLSIAADPEIKNAFVVMFKFLEGLFLRKVVAYGIDANRGADFFSATISSNQEEALKDIGIRDHRVAGPAKDFRATIQIQNHFQQHTMEVSFSEPVVISTNEQMQIFKSKVTNALMQWHSKWNLLIDCTNLTMDPSMVEPLKAVLKFFSGFFMKSVIGYGKSDPVLPFPTYRARHKAVAQQEAEGYFSGDAAHCKSTQKAK